MPNTNTAKQEQAAPEAKLTEDQMKISGPPTAAETPGRFTTIASGTTNIGDIGNITGRTFCAG